LIDWLHVPVFQRGSGQTADCKLGTKCRLQTGYRFLTSPSPGLSRSISNKDLITKSPTSPRQYNDAKHIKYIFQTYFGWLLVFLLEIFFGYFDGYLWLNWPWSTLTSQEGKIADFPDFNFVFQFGISASLHFVSILQSPVCNLHFVLTDFWGYTVTDKLQKLLRQSLKVFRRDV